MMGAVSEAGYAAGFEHDALLYDSPESYTRQTTRFIRDGFAADDAILVMTTADKLGLIKDALGADAERVTFGDMSFVGRNPARIIPAWQSFVSANLAAGRTVRGIGEPIWAGRTPDELVECQHHEALLNVAFDSGPAWRLLCPYDVTALPAAVIAEAQRSHPRIRDDAELRSSELYDRDGSPSEFGPLPEPDSVLVSIQFDHAGLPEVREIVAARGQAHGLAKDRLQDFVLAVHEVAANSVRHGGGTGHLRLWTEAAALVCEVRDAGRLTDPLAGRVRPTQDQERCMGLWLVNQICDLVQIRPSGDGAVLRLRISRDA